MQVMRDVNTALYHTGRLAYDMFAYPQRVGTDSILMTYGMGSEQKPSLRRLSELFYDLGLVNEAEHYAHESLELEGWSPETLELLVKTNILKGQTEAARTFLGLLCRNILYREWAEDCLQRMDADPTGLNGDAEIASIKATMSDKDYVMAGQGAAEQLGPALLRAVEYRVYKGLASKRLFENLMGYYLLARNLDRAVLCLASQPFLDYPDIPRHYEEAVLIYSTENPDAALELEGMDISQQTKSRFSRFLQACGSLGRNKRTDRDLLIAQYSGSYLLYYAAGFSDARWADLQVAPAATTGATK